MKKDTIHNLTIALAGNPNCGKTTLFNALTGAKQYVGNWPGVTVERMEGIFTHQNTNVQVIDLPGIYSFSAYSLDEKVSREFILLDKPDLVVNIIDATNLERNLYLTAQLLEMKIPLVVALNMMDAAKQKKIRIEVEHLATHLNCPVIPIVAAKKTGSRCFKRRNY
jgi:ferrous iron transport protein B